MHNPYDLGYSSRKLLTLASILAMDTPVIVLDEPTTGQDARGVARIQRVIADLSSAGRTVIAISHDMRFVGRDLRAGRGHGRRPPAPRRPPATSSTSPPGRRSPRPTWSPVPRGVGARLGLGSTPTEASLVDALSARG